MIEEVSAQLNNIKVVRKTSQELAKFTTEEDFTGLSVDALIEVGQYVCVVSSFYSTRSRCWNRNQAIVGGQMVRLYKLISAILDQTCQHRREIAFILARLAFETIVNVKYLIANASQELFDSYVCYSLKHEKKLLNKIEHNIKQRNGEILPIEERMLRSIKTTFVKSEVTRDQVSTNEPRNWGGKNIYQKAEDVGLSEAYLGVFGGGSHSVHGNWMDLLGYQLQDVEGGFRAQHDWRYPRPQINFAISLLTTHALAEYSQFLAIEELSALMLPRIADVVERIEVFDAAHESYLGA